jgi:hypothetical protein
MIAVQTAEPAADARMIAILRTIVESNCTFVLRIAISHAGAPAVPAWT